MIAATMLRIEICPFEPRAEVAEDIEREGALADDLLDCTGPGDAEPACRYVADTWLPLFVIADRANGYARRPAKPSEIQKTCEAIYHDHEKGEFADMRKATLYLVWEAANTYAQEVESC